MRAGQLRHRLELQMETQSQDSAGQPTKSWTTMSTVWGEVKPIMGRERFTADQIQGEVSHEINIRNRTDVTSAWRILFGSRIFNIVGPPVRPNERNISLRLMALEEA